jgi:hypothetical protein
MELYNRLKELQNLTDKLNYIKENNINPSYELLFNLHDNGRIQRSVIFKAAYYKLLKDIILVNKPKTLLDPFCGLGFLLFHLPKEISSHGLNVNKDEAKVSHYFNPNAKIECKDAFNVIFNTNYDCIASILNPFGQRHNRLSELILKLLNSLNAAGNLFLTVPSNFLSTTAFENTRKIIQKEYSLEFIAELPINRFHGIRFNLIHIKNQKQRSNILLTTLDDYDKNKIISDYVNQEGQFWIPQNQLTYRWDIKFYDPKYLEIENELNKQDTKPLEEISEEIQSGIHVPADYRKDKGDYLVLTPGNIKSNLLITSKRQYYCDEVDNKIIRNFNRAILKPGDILFSLLGPKFKLYIYNENDPKAVANQNFAIIRAYENKYIKAYLESKTGYDAFLQQAERRSKGATIQRLTLSDLRKIKVPILPYEQLNELIQEPDKFTSFSESKIALVMEEKLKEKGWSIKWEYKVNNTIIDLALCIENKPIGLVEIKQYKSDRDINQIKNQLKHLINTTGFKLAFTFFDHQLYEYNGIEFIPIEDFPSINEVLKNTFEGNLLEETASVYQSQTSSYATKFMLEIFSLIQQMSSDIEEIKNTTKHTEEKIDIIIDLVLNLNKEFGYIKNNPLEIEEKLTLFNRELDEKIKELQNQENDQLDKYSDLVKTWLNYDWERLEELSKQYLPSAEFIFLQLSNLINTDFSPFIIQYCRALETELLNKIFRAYIDEIKAKNTNIEVEFAWDFEKKENGQPNNENTLKFAKQLKGYLNTGRSQWFFELGNMELYLRYLTGNTSKKSPILIDLKKFLLTYFEENILELEFLNELNRITKEYRNRAAHSDIITLDEAKKGRKEIQELLKKFLEYYK